MKNIENIERFDFNFGGEGGVGNQPKVKK